jgi:hypothetical protein
MINLTSASAVAICLSHAFWVSYPPSQAKPLENVINPVGLSAGNVLACDTAEEVEAVLLSQSKGITAQIMAVNTHYGTHSCNVATVAFVEGVQAKVILVPDGIVRIIKVDVVGIRTGERWASVTRPMSRYVGVLDDATTV